MKERPILFKGPMVKAILDGTKTQTRRVVNPQPWSGTMGYQDRYGQDEPNGLWWPYDYPNGDGKRAPCDDAIRCPYGKPGDHLWVKETHYLRGRWIKNGRTKTGRQRWRFRPAKGRDVRYVEAPPKRLGRKRGARKDQWWKRPSIFMPRWASRITLEVTGVRVERVQEISEEDACAEGFIEERTGGVGEPTFGEGLARAWFRKLWDSINSKRGFGWDVNPWVWMVDFKRIRP